jgi:hypothetical protein
MDATLERFHRLAVLSSEFADALRLLLKHGGDGPDRVAGFELLGERVFGQFCPGLPFIVSQGGVEEGLEMRRPGWENHGVSRAAQPGRWNWKKLYTAIRTGAVFVVAFKEEDPHGYDPLMGAVLFLSSVGIKQVYVGPEAELPVSWLGHRSSSEASFILQNHLSSQQRQQSLCQGLQ